MKEYWSNRFKAGGKIWGDQPSISAKQAGVLFESEKAESILVPGAGYGRHTCYFDRLGFDVEGIEISHEAIKLAKEANPQIQYYEGSVLDMPFTDKKYNAIYCFNVLHLFEEKDRKKFIGNCINALKRKGLIYFTVFSEQEETFGKGAKIEENTYESNPGRFTHYFTEKDLKKSFSGFEILGTGIIEESESHGESGHHIHKLRYIFAKKIGE